MGPNPNQIYPNKAILQVVFIQNIITRSNIEVGGYTYYDDVNGAEHYGCPVQQRSGKDPAHSTLKCRRTIFVENRKRRMLPMGASSFLRDAGGIRSIQRRFPAAG